MLCELLTNWAEPHPEIVAAYLFGSAGRGQIHSGSDVDVALLLEPEALAQIRAEQRMGYETNAAVPLSRVFGGVRVDIVVLNEAPALLARRAIFGGKVAFTRDERARIAHATEVQDRYLSTAPLRTLRRDYLRRRFGGTAA